MKKASKTQVVDPIQVLIDMATQIQKSPLARQNSRQAEVMEAEVASEGRAAAKPKNKKPAKKSVKKIDKRTTPEFIAHLRALAAKRKADAQARREKEDKKTLKKVAKKLEKKVVKGAVLKKGA